MTWALLAAMAVFVAWHGDPQPLEESRQANMIYEKYYTWPACIHYDEDSYMNSWKYKLFECSSSFVWERDRDKEFYIVFDLKNQTRERHRKTTLLWLYAQQRYESTK